MSATGSLENGGYNPYFDAAGAAKYIIVVVLVYGFGIIFFIASQVRSSDKVLDEVDSVNAEKILRSMETELFTKDVLEKLSDPGHRERAWKIYLSDGTSMSPNTTTASKTNDSTKTNTEAASCSSQLINNNNNNKSNDIESQNIESSSKSNNLTLPNDREMVDRIEKKLKLLQKVQS